MSFKRNILDYFHTETKKIRSRDEIDVNEEVESEEIQRDETESVVSLLSTELSEDSEHESSDDLCVSKNDVVTISSESELSEGVKTNSCKSNINNATTCATSASLGNASTAEFTSITSTSSSCTVSSSVCTSQRHIPTDIAVGPHQLPAQPVGPFPSQTCGKRKRSFNSEWYKMFPWIEYSKESDSVFCFPCRFFASRPGRVDEAFISNGFHDWKHALGKKGALHKHSKSIAHKDALICFNGYKHMQESNSSVADMVGSARAQHVAKNIHYVKSIAEVIMLCCQQNIGLRGHKESEKSLNKGNFLEIFNLLANHDHTIKDKLKSISKNAVYTLPDIQNSISQVMGDMIRSKISDEVKRAGYFTLMADESRDCSKIEQLAMIFRYVDVDSGNIHERFLTFVQADNLNAEALQATLEPSLINTSLIIQK